MPLSRSKSTPQPFRVKADPCSAKAVCRTPWTASMASKRAVSEANVSAKKAKLGRDLAVLNDKGDKVQFQKDMEWLQIQLKNNPGKMKSVKNVMSLDDQSKHNKDVDFHPDIVGKSLARLPPNFIMKEWLVELGGLTREELLAILKANAKSAHRILYRLTYQSPEAIIHLTQKEAWKKYQAQRCQVLGSDLNCLHFDRSFVIDWQVSGHFSLLPPLPKGIADTATHLYETIKFRDVEVPLDGDFKVRGVCWIEDNWLHDSAYIRNPGRPELKLVCKSFFDRDKFVAMLPDEQLLAIENAPEKVAEDSSAMKAIEDNKSVKSASPTKSDVVRVHVQVSTTEGSQASEYVTSSLGSSPSKVSWAAGPQVSASPRVIGIPGVRKPPKGPPARRELHLSMREHAQSST
jgi:hypothetical protein